MVERMASRLGDSPFTAMIHVRGPEPDEKGYIRLHMSAVNGSWDAPVHSGQRKDGSFATTFFVPAGFFEWDASLRPEEALSSEPPRSVLGRVEVAAGDIAEVWARIPH